MESKSELKSAEKEKHTQESFFASFRKLVGQKKINFRKPEKLPEHIVARSNSQSGESQA